MKYFKILSVIPVILSLAVTKVWAQEPYAVLSDNNTVLTFYYDDQKDARGGMSVGPFTDYDERGWYDSRESIITAVFDDTFADFTTLTSTAWWFQGCSNLTSLSGIENLNTANVTDMSYMFTLCSALVSLDVSGFNTASVTDMDYMFSVCSGLTSLDVSGFNTENVTSMGGMFLRCSGLTSLDLSSFNTANVTGMYDMFSGCSGLTSLDVSGFNTEKVTSMHSMFTGCSGLTSLDLSSFNTANVTYMFRMFYGCSNLTSLDLSSFNTANVTEMDYMFYDCSGLTSLDVSGFNTENVTNMVGMFYDCFGLTSLDVSGFNTSNVTDMSGMFYGCSGLTSLDVSGFNTENVTSMNDMFDGCSGLTSLDVSGFNTANVTDMGLMFSGCKGLTSLDLSNFNTANVTNMEAMFSGCSGLTSLDVSGFNTSKVSNMSSMFYRCSSLTSLDLGNFNTANVSHMTSMFLGCSGLTSLDLSNFNTANVTDMRFMFFECSSLTSLDLSNFNTANVTDMRLMFIKCSSLTSLDVSGFNTENVTSMNDMFYSCSGLTSLDVSSFNTSNVTDMSGMFDGCSGLTSLDVSGFNTENVTDMGYMFGNCEYLTTIYAGNGWSTAAVTEGNEVFRECTNLVGGAGTTYDPDHTDYTYAHIDGGVNNPGYFTSKDAPTEIYAPYFNFEGDNLTMTSDTQGAIIFYAMEGYSTEDEANDLRDNMTVDTQNTLYQDPIPVTTNVVVKAIAFVQGQGMSDVTTLVYDYDAWQGLLQTMVHGEDVLSRSDITMPNDSLQGVLDDLRNDLTWMLDESHHFYQERAMMDSYEARHFAMEIQDVCDKIEELLNKYAPGEPYAVLTESNTVLTFYYDNHKETRGGMDLGAVVDETYPAWFDERQHITTVVFDDSFANCTTINSTAYWFCGFTNLMTISGISNLKTENVTDMRYMFENCWSLNTLDVSNFKTNKVTNMRYMFRGCNGLGALDVSNFDTENVTDAFCMFRECSSLGALDLSNFKTAHIVNMSRMFEGCSSLTSLDLSGFNTANVTDMSYMFEDCSSLTSLDLSSFNTANVTDMYYMFSGCSNLSTIYVSDQWSTAAVTEGNEVFRECTNLVGGAGTTYDPDHTDYTYAHIDGGVNNPGYFTSKDAPTEIYAPYFNFEGDNLTMTSDTQGAIIFYAMEGYSTEDEANDLRDNMTVDTQNTLYQDPIPVTTNVVVKAIAFVQGQGMSDVTTLVYDYDAWQGLLQTIAHGEDVLSRSDITMPNDSLQGVLDDLRNDLTWMLDESRHFYQERAMMDSYEANHFAMEIQNVCNKIEELLNEYSPSEPYAVLSDNNTVLTFYYDDQKDARGGMSVGPFGNSSGRWNGHAGDITTVVFDDSFADCTTLTSMAYWFYDCTSLTSIEGIINLKTANVTNMHSMFWGCRSLTSLDLSNFNTANVTEMQGMFADCPKLTSLDVSGFNTSNVSDMVDMFYGCSGLTSLDVSGFNTSNVSNMHLMFYGCSNLTSLDLSSFNTANVTDMSRMFSRCTGLTSLDVSGFNTLNVTSMNGMFQGCSSLTSLDVSGFNTENVTDIIWMFSDCSGLTSLDVSGFNTSNVTDMVGMFAGCPSLTSLDLSGFNTENVTDMRQMFYKCSGLTSLDLSSFNTENVTDMSYMFTICSNLSTIYVSDQWSTAAVTVGNEVFRDCINLVGGAGTTFDENHTNYTYAHIDGGVNNPGYFTSKDAPASPEPYAVLSDNNTVLTFYYDDQKDARGGMSVGPFGDYPDRGWNAYSPDIQRVVFSDSFADYRPEATNHWFYNMNNLTVIEGIENLHTERVESMQGMFHHCYNLQDLDVSGFNTMSVTNMWGVFEGCRSLTTLDVSSFDTSNAVTMESMFRECSSLTTLDLRGFHPANVTNFYAMFKDCSSLVSVDLRNFNTPWVSNWELFFDNCSSLSSIQASYANIPQEVYASIENPNLLVYVNEESLAPQSVTNVVVDGRARLIVLTDTEDGNNNWYCPEPFYADSIVYTHEYRMTTQIGVSRGWETIALPFNVQNIRHEKNGALAPFGSGLPGKPFWLRELTDHGLEPAERIHANMPYLISMPNSSAYLPEYNQAGTVTFSASNTEVYMTEQRGMESNDRVLMPAFQRVAPQPDVYAVNRNAAYDSYPEGSVFVAGYREVRPFEAYTLHPNGGAKLLTIDDLMNGDTDFIDIHEMMPSATVKVYDLSGVLIKSGNANEVMKQLPRGIYIVNGMKVVK